MSLKDKLEIGLKPDAPYRPDNLPDGQQDDETCAVAATPGESDDVRAAREACDTGAAAKPPEQPPKPARKA